MAVTVALNAPGLLLVQEKVAVVVEEGSVTLDGLGWAQVRPVVAGAEDRSTVPLNPFCPVIVTFDFADTPTFAGKGDGFDTVTAKSVKLKVGLGTTVFVMPLVPLTTTE